MKKLLFAFLLCLSASAVQAQEVYEAVMIGAQDVLDNPKADENQLKIAQFKVTALGYLHRKMVERDPNTPARELDVQAYYMSEFVTRFLADVVRHGNDAPAERKQRIMNFVNLSVGNPLFNDPDKKTTEVYLKDDDNLTPFSLDTDWKKACEALMQDAK